jgi:hypothetical protein
MLTSDIHISPDSFQVGLGRKTGNVAGYDENLIEVLQSAGSGGHQRFGSVGGIMPPDSVAEFLQLRDDIISRQPVKDGATLHFLGAVAEKAGLENHFGSSLDHRVRIDRIIRFLATPQGKDKEKNQAMSRNELVKEIPQLSHSTNGRPKPFIAPVTTPTEQPHDSFPPDSLL